jgi:hypothetical protein
MQGGFRRRPVGGKQAPQPPRPGVTPSPRPTAWPQPAPAGGAGPGSKREASLRRPKPKPLSGEGLRVHTEWVLILITIAGFALLAYHAFGGAAVVALDTIVAGL